MFGKEIITIEHLNRTYMFPVFATAEAAHQIDDNSITRAACVFRAPRTISGVNQFGVKIANRTVDATPDLQYEVSLQGVDAVYEPDGTKKTANETGNVEATGWSPGADGWHWQAWDSSRTYDITRGDDLSLVFDNTSGTPNLDYFSVQAHDGTPAMGHPKWLTEASGSWTWQNDEVPFVALRNSSSGEAMLLPIKAVFQLPHFVTTTTDISGLTFTIPKERCRRLKVAGMILPMLAQADYKVGIWLKDATPTEVVTKTCVFEMHKGGYSGALGYFYFDSDTWLDAGTEYVAGIQGTQAGNMSTYSHQLAESGDITAFSGPQNGTTSVCEFNSGSGWADRSGYIPAELSLLVSEVDHGEPLIHLPGSIEL